ncbi:MAG TPA: hypothetical protein VFC19_08340 [Candidatus Limnocylindrales bacterium]|nr:hypothetical protein [Candidatus Limnocylindrales bacterium]
MKTRLARFGAAAVLSLSLLTACGGGEGTDVDCNLDRCTVTFDRGADAKASVLGVEAKLVSVEGDKATVEVAGERLTLTVGQPATEAEGLQVTLDSVTDTQVKIKISR